MSVTFDSLIQQILSVGILCATRYFRDTAANKNISTILHLWHFHFSREGQTINKHVINKKNKTVIALKIYGRCYIKWYLCKDKKKYEKKVSKEEHFKQREQLAWKPGVGEHLACWKAARRPHSTWEVGLENGEVGDKCSLCRALWGTVRTLHYTLNERRFNQWRDMIWLTFKRLTVNVGWRDASGQDRGTNTSEKTAAVIHMWSNWNLN